MALTSSTTLGPYEIQSPLGAGGMGEVYRARDTRLDRTVAVKILPSHLSENLEAKQRFDREARHLFPESFQYLYALRCRPPGWSRLSGHGISRRRNSGRPFAEGSAYGRSTRMKSAKAWKKPTKPASSIAI